ncbi:hypothetical protein E4U43_007552 [Claviceps pusilla]|uniref:Uncharacterized protein n=1 Tax=Claviceps pusilla TaxID=123648 RepID=A0A9P7NDD0_9HYPO|nr:hypothetical protein E4U43_007552 [Claviceps pusilla]
MDMAKRRLGTSSNGSLHSTFTTYGSHFPTAPAGPRNQASAQQRRPLRSISHNPSLPPSPGLLVSMLKTATEMGDVGTFPMQKQPVTPTVYHQLPRSRSDLVAATPPPKYTPKRNENYYYAEDGRPFRSYRDTTSEIISLYAYDNQPHIGNHAESFQRRRTPETTLSIPISNTAKEARGPFSISCGN